MLAVRASGDTVLAMLPDGLEIAAENAPSSTVVSGETSAIEDFEAHLAEHGLAARRLATSHAFHSAMMDPILEDFADVVDTIPRSAPVLPWISGLTGDWITQEQAQDSAYWVQQVRRPVLFAKGVTRLLEDPTRVTLEVGPGQQLTGLAKRSVPRSAGGRRDARDGEAPAHVAARPGRRALGGRCHASAGIRFERPGRASCPAPELSVRTQALLGGADDRTHGCRPAAPSAPGDNQPVVIAAASPGTPSRRATVCASRRAHPRPVRRPVGHGRRDARPRRDVPRARPRFAPPDPGCPAAAEDLRRQGLLPRPARRPVDDRRLGHPPRWRPSCRGRAGAGTGGTRFDRAGTRGAAGGSDALRRRGAPDRRATGDHAPAAGDAPRWRAATSRRLRRYHSPPSLVLRASPTTRYRRAAAPPVRRVRPVPPAVEGPERAG